MARGNKFNARKVMQDGITFDSSAEANRYLELILLQRAGEITGLLVHPRFTVWRGVVKKKVQHVDYEPDFVYLENGRTVAEDVKGFETEAFRMKAKMFQAMYPEIDFRVLKVR